MMIKKSITHRQLSALKKRGHLNVNSIKYLNYLESGYIGEVTFSNIFDQVMRNYSVTIHDFRFKVNGTERQIDTLAIFNHFIIIFEVKNYKGNHVYKDGNFYLHNSNKELKSPIQQVNDISEKFTLLLNQLNYNIPIKKHVIYIGKNFHLYNAPPTETIITYSQLQDFLEALKYEHTFIKPHANKIKNDLLNHYVEDHRQCDVDYTFEGIKKGVFCELDGERLIETGLEKYKCSHCNKFYQQKDVVKEIIEDFQTLFPNQTLTIKKLHEFTDQQISQYKLRKILNQHYKKKGKYRNTHYINES